MTIFPDKANSILRVYPDCMLPQAILLKSMKFVSRRYSQVAQICRRIEHIELTTSDFADIGWNRGTGAFLPEFASSFVCE